MDKSLHAVADAEDGEAGFENVLRDVGRVRFVDGARTAGEDEAFGADGHDLIARRVPREELAVDMRLADAASDELGVLGAEVEDGEGIGHQSAVVSWLRR
jgi:hypothetical protein